MYTSVLIATIFIFLASALLSVLLTLNFFRKSLISYIYWSAGMWLFALASFLEILFSVGIYSIPLIDIYLFSVAVLVQLLSLGSLGLLKRDSILRAYAGYSVAADVVLILSLAFFPVGNILTNGVVFGLLPLLVTIASSIITFPAAVILIIVGALSYRTGRDIRMLSIIAGTIVVSIAGTLYIAAYPAFLYYAEFLGIILLWLGFVDFRYLFRVKEVNKSVNG
ncbi:MAG: hypothetical protein ACP5NK_01925 [Thermoplasmata archaeon]